MIPVQTVQTVQTVHPVETAQAQSGPAAPATESVLPELRAMWWERGMHARATAGPLQVLGQLPKLIGAAMAISWRADRVRTLIVAGATIMAGTMSAFGLLATQQVLVELFATGPTPDRVAAALPALILLAVVTGVRASMGIATGYAQNGLTPRVDMEVERRLFETTTRVRLDAFDADEFADDMERASRGTDAAIGLVQGTFNLLAGVAGLIAVIVAVVLIHPLLVLALLVATVPTAWATLKAGHQRYRTYVAGSVRRRRLWVLHRLMAERKSAPELRSYGLRDFLLRQYDTVMGAETAIQLRLARTVTTTITVGSLIGGIATTAVYVLLGVLLLQGAIPLAAAATCVIAVQAAQRSLSTVTIHVDRIYTDGQHFGDYTLFMTRAEQHMPAATGTAEPGPLREITVDGISMTYPDRETPAVDDVTLRIIGGQTVAFVGENGSGKSTLAAIIAGLRSPDHGQITWNGRPVSELDSNLLTGRIAVVSQDFHRWPFTAATNIALGRIGGATPAADPGTESGTETGAQPRAATGKQPGTGTGEQTGTGAGEQTGTRAGAQTGTRAGAQTGTRAGAQTGAGTGTETGAETGAETGTTTGAQTGAGSNAETGAVPDERRIHDAARLAAAHDMILELPHGYDTLLDRTFKDGQDLSGGQWQRITAARGFLRLPDLLIMDEPSSALDPRAEHALFQAIRDRQGRSTTILITHRLANVRHADVIYVLERGRLVESGSHDQLVAAGGSYADLFALQSRGYQQDR